MKLKQLTLILAIMCLVTAITACSSNGKSEHEICNEIEQYFKNDYQFTKFDNVSVKITQRQTNKDDKTDYVWASVSASNADLQYNGEYYAIYVLYNDGWVLEYCIEEYAEGGLTRSTVTESQAMKAVQDECLANYEKLELVEQNTDLDSGEDSFYFEGQYTDGYLSAVDTVKVMYYYNYRTSCWELDSVKRISTAETWDVLGEWEYSANGETMWLYIHNIDAGSVNVEFDFDYTWEYDSAWYGLTREDQHFVSKGIETRQLDPTENGTSFNLVDDMPSTPYVYISKTQGVTFDGYWSNPDDSYILTRTGQ